MFPFRKLFIQNGKNLLPCLKKQPEIKKGRISHKGSYAPYKIAVEPFSLMKKIGKGQLAGFTKNLLFILF